MPSGKSIQIINLNYDINEIKIERIFASLRALRMLSCNDNALISDMH